MENQEVECAPDHEAELDGMQGGTSDSDETKIALLVAEGNQNS